MTDIGSGASLFLAGCVASCGVLLVVAGAGKVYRAARRVPDASAVRRALGVTRRRWRRVETAAGLVEGAAGVIVCAGVYPAAGAVFLRGQAGAFGRPWFWAGILAGGAVLVLLSARALPRTPVCRRPVWFPARATLRTLAGHGVFEAMAESAGPFGPVVRYRRSGCSEEFWFTTAAGPGRADDDAARAVVFQARYGAPGGSLAVQASVRDAPAPGDWPARAIGARDAMLVTHR